MTGRIRIDDPGAMTSVQDMGRIGYQALGVSTSGALDFISLKVANALVGNPANTAALELRLTGPSITVREGAVRVALAGTDTSIKLLGEAPRALAPGRSHRLPAGSTFRIGSIRDSGVCYLAFQGGLDLEPILGSSAFHHPSSLGGFGGAPCQAGQEITVPADAKPDGERQLPARADRGDKGPIRVVLGPQADAFSKTAIETFLASPYTVTAQSNRMGLQLSGARLTHLDGFNIASDGIVSGSIQVPGTGAPIILLADRQTTGGYPKIATVISSDLPRLGRSRPGDTLTFSAIDASSAEKIRRELEQEIEKLCENLPTVVPDKEDLSDILMRENLIDGVVGPNRDRN